MLAGDRWPYKKYLVKVIAPKMGVTRSRQHLKNTITNLKN
jgi:hypothetical protein